MTRIPDEWLLETEPGLQAGSLHCILCTYLERQAVEPVAFASGQARCNLHRAFDGKVFQQLGQQIAGVVRERGGFFVPGPGDENDELPSGVLVSREQPLAQVVQGAAAEPLVPLGEFLGEDRVTPAAERCGKVGERGLHSMGGFVEDERARLVDKRLEAPLPGRASRGKKPFEDEAVGRKTRRTERAHQRTGSGNGQDLGAGLANAAHDKNTGVADERGPRVAHHGEALSFLETPHDLRRHSALIVVVQGTESGLDAVGSQKAATVPSILGENGVHLSQYRERARADVGRVADRSGDDVEDARRAADPFIRIAIPFHFGSEGSGARFLVYRARMSRNRRNPAREGVSRAGTPLHEDRNRTNARARARGARGADRVAQSDGAWTRAGTERLRRTPTNPIHRLIAGLFLAASLGACVEAPPRPDDAADLAAWGLLAEGRFADAATEYRRLAELSQGDAVWYFTLNAAQALLAGDRPDGALEGLAQGDWTGASPAQRIKRAALRAEIVLARGDEDRALALLPDEVVNAASPSMARGMRRTRADAFFATGRRLDAALEGVALEELGLGAEAARENRHFIWRALGGLGGAELNAARVSPSRHFGGWVELALLHRTLMFDHADFRRGVIAWRERFSEHPAGSELVPQLLAESLVASKPPAKVALLLPAHGAFAEAGRTIRDGFIAAWYGDGDSDARPAIIVRDTSDADIATLVAGVAEEGAEFIVGPLRKSSVREAAAIGRPAVPMLALNLVTDDAQGPPAEDFYQFALSPEGEAREVAQRAWRDGYARAAVLAPEGEWGTRVAGAFSNAWQQLGGHVVETQRYATESDDESQPPDMSVPVVMLLNIDESSQRRDELRTILGRGVRFEARRRTDADIVFMAGFPREVRQLRPQFEFHDAADVPIYSTSHVYTGIPDPEKDSDIDDVIFGDMPMVVPASSDSEALRGQLFSLWPDRLRASLRLYAFGLDAFALITRLRYLEAWPDNVFQGLTGRLRLDEKGRVHRQLTWAHFEHGLPRPLDPRLMAP